MKKKVVSLLLAMLMVLSTVTILSITAFAEPELVDCPDCGGTGRQCNRCGGTGICYTCSGSGKCKECGGTGKGDMRDPICWLCDGDGKCFECGGTKKCNDCNDCATCGGTGKVEATPASFTVTDGTAQDANGSISFDKTSAAENDTVTVTVSPEANYMLDTLTVVDADGEEVEVTKDLEDPTKYTFVMPAKEVTVTATFEVAIKPTTVADLLEALDSFPTTEGSGIPEGAWVNENGFFCARRKTDSYDKLYFLENADNFFSKNCSEPLTEVTDGFLYEGDGITILFRLTDGVLTAITVTQDTLDDYDGTYAYKAPHTHDAGVKQEGRAATDTDTGWNDYYKCDCGLYFEDEACTKEIGNDAALEAWKTGKGAVPALGHEFGADHRCTRCHDMDPQYQLEKDAALALVKGVYELDTGTLDFASADEMVSKNGEALYGVNELKFYRVDNVVYVIHGGSSHTKRVTFTLDDNDKVISVTTHDTMSEEVNGTYTAKKGANLTWLWILLGVLGLLIVLYVVFFFVWKKKEELPDALAFLGFLEPSYKAINNALFKKKDDKE